MKKAKAAVCLLVSSIAQIIVNQGTFPCPKEIFKETLCIMKQIVCFVAPDLHLYSCEINGKFLLTLTGTRLDLSASGV